MVAPATAQVQPAITVSTALSESAVERDSPTGPTVTVIPGGSYAGSSVTLTSQALSPGGNTGTLSVFGGGQALLDATSIVRMDSASPATSCCTYGVLVSDAGSVVNSAATVVGSTGGAAAYNGGRLNLDGGSMSGMFGVVSSGAGSLITGAADISGSGSGASAGTGVRAELGGHVVLTGGRVLSNGMTATDAGSAIDATSVQVTGAVNASNGASVTLSGGSVTTSGFGTVALAANGASHITSSADISSSGGGGAGAVAARGGSTADITGGNLNGSVGASGAGSTVNFANATVTQDAAQGSVGVYANSGGTVVLNSGLVNAPAWNNTAVVADGAGSVIRNVGTTIQGVAGSSTGARASNGGAFILEAGGAMASSTIGVQATGTGSTITSSGTISASQRAAYASSGGRVDLNGGSMATTEYNANAAGVVADSSGVVNVANAALLNTATFGGNGLMALSGGRVNVAGGTLAVTGTNASGLVINGAGSAIDTVAPLTVNASGASTRAVSVANGASQAFSNLTATASGANGNVVAFNTGANQLTFNSSTLGSTSGPAVIGQSGSLDLTLSGSQLSGPTLVQDNGNAITITANAGSTLSGSANAANTAIALNGNSRWQVGAGNSSVGSLALDSGALEFNGASATAVTGGVTFGAGGGTIDTHGFDVTLGASTTIGTGSLTKTGAGRLILSSGIGHTGDTTVSDGILQIGDGTAVGTVHLGHVDNNGTLVFQRPDVAMVDMVAGSGTLQQDGAGTTVLNGDNTYTGGTTVNAGLLQLGNGGTAGSVTGEIAVNAAGTLAIHRSDAVTLGNALTGTGLVTVDTAGQAFNFAGTTGTAFGGTVAVGASTFHLGDTNTAALANATLRADAGSTTTVADGVQTIGGLNINGGTMVFDAQTLAQEVATSTITAHTLDASHAGTVQITLPQPYTPSAPDVPNSVNLLKQDDANVGTKLVNAANIVGSGGALALVDQNGNAISAGQQVDIAQGGSVVAKGTYDFRLTTAPGDGLYVNYGLSQLAVQAGQTLTLEKDSGATGASADMSARITGTGNLAIRADAGTVSLSNATNDYTGETTAVSGTLRLDANNALGQTSMLHIANAATTDLNSRSQTIGAFDGQTGSSLTLNGGTLTIAQGGTSAGTLAGAGQLNLTGGVLDVQGANSALTASTAIAASATVQLHDVAGLGRGAIATEGALMLDGVGGAFANSISGTGAVILANDSAVNATGNNGAFSGAFNVTTGSSLTVAQAENLGTAAVANNGKLVVNNATDWELANAVSGTGELVKEGSGTLTISSANSYSGGTALKSGRIDLGHSHALGTGVVAMDENTTLGFAADGLDIANAVVLTGTTDPVIDTGGFTGTLSGEVSGAGALTKNGSGTLVLAGLNTYTGATTVAEGTLRAGAAHTFSAESAHTVATGATLDTAGFDQTVASLNNNGTVSLLSGAPGSTLTVKGAYVGNNGVLQLGTTLSDSGGTSDRLVLNGPQASASGKTTVQVTNLGGLGALTTGNGINVVTAENGATTTAQTTKDAFALANGHVDAGAFEYRLYAADANGDGENWYLRSTNPQLNQNPASETPTYRAEVPLYTALPNVLRQSDLAMLSNLHRRVGDEAVTDSSAAAGAASRLGWARVINNDTTIEQGGTTSPRSDANLQGLQAGVDLFTTPTWNMGMYAGYLRGDTRVDGFYGLNSFARNYAGNLRTDSTYLGGYATYANPQGQYADFVLQYGHHDITGTSPLGLGSDSGGNSVTASAEVGQRFALGEGWGIEPQAQLIVNRQDLGNTTISSAVVSQDTATSAVGRLGVRVAGDYVTNIGRLRPYARVNVWHGFGGTDTSRFITPAATTSIASNVGYTSTEAAAGFTLNVTPTASVYGEVGKLYQSGGETRISSSVQGSVGLRLKF